MLTDSLRCAHASQLWWRGVCRLALLALWLWALAAPAYTTPAQAAPVHPKLPNAMPRAEAEASQVYLPYVATSDPCQDVTEIPQPECAALVAFYQSTNGPGWVDNSGWLQTATPCSWYGVSCDAGSVHVLSLRSNGLSGSLPAALSALGNLQELNLRSNGLGGVIPPDLASLANLQVLNLRANAFSGAIPPNLSALAQLQRLDLRSNQLSGALPAELASLAELQELHLGSNLLSGSLPPGLGQLANLRELSLNTTQLSGPLPLSLTGLTALAYFHFDETQLCIPADTALQSWLAAIPDMLGTNTPCPAL